MKLKAIGFAACAIVGIGGWAVGVHGLHGLQAGFAANSDAVMAATAQARPAAPAEQQKPEWVAVGDWEGAQ